MSKVHGLWRVFTIMAAALVVFLLICIYFKDNRVNYLMSEYTKQERTLRQYSQAIRLYQEKCKHCLHWVSKNVRVCCYCNFFKLVMKDEEGGCNKKHGPFENGERLP